MLIKWDKSIAWDIDAESALGVLVVGSTEQHSKYLPTGTDSLLGEKVAELAAQKADARIVMLPVQRIGFSHHHRAFPGVLTVKTDVMISYLTEVCLSAFNSGIRKLLIINSHGGNYPALQAVVNRLGSEYGKEAVLLSYWNLVSDKINSVRRSAMGGMGHAGELETSLMLHFYPELVDKSRITEYPVAKGDEWHNPDLVAKNKIYRYIPFDTYSDDGNIGQPHLASAEEGRVIAEAAVTELASLMEFLHRSIIV